MKEIKKSRTFLFKPTSPLQLISVSLLQTLSFIELMVCFIGLSLIIDVLVWSPLIENRHKDKVRKLIITSHGRDAQNLPYV